MKRIRELSFPLWLPLAEACAWRPENIAEATAEILVDKVPGLTIDVRPTWRQDPKSWDAGTGLELVGRYACPCGEISGLSWTWSVREQREGSHYPLDVWAKLEADRLLELLREHVRSEGNEPGF